MQAGFINEPDIYNYLIISVSQKRCENYGPSKKYSPALSGFPDILENIFSYSISHTCYKERIVIKRDCEFYGKALWVTGIGNYYTNSL
jgi:hypothetical protein